MDEHKQENHLPETAEEAIKMISDLCNDYEPDEIEEVQDEIVHTNELKEQDPRNENEAHNPLMSIKHENRKTDGGRPMKVVCKITRIILGAALILLGIYIIIQTQFILRIIDGQMADGFGFALTEDGEQFLLNSIVIWAVTIISIGGGFGLISSTRKKR